jgi:PAS domain S-box-containing protein
VDSTGSQGGLQQERGTGADTPACAAAAYADVVGVSALIVGIAILAGWVLGLPGLSGLVRSWPQMSPLTAVTTALCGMSMILGGEGPRSLTAPLHHRSAAISCAALALLLGLTRLALHVSGQHGGIDILWLRRLAAPYGTPSPVMSSATALGTAFIGCALTLTQTAWTRSFQTLAVLSALIAWLGLTRYLFGGAPLVPYSQMSIYTALMLLLLATGVLARRTDTGIVFLLTDPGPAGHGLRRLLPAALIVPMLAGMLALYAERRLGLGHEQGYALFTSSDVVLFAALIWANAVQVWRLAGERQRTQEALHEREELLQGIVGSTDDAVITKTLDGIITFWNAAAERLFGYSSSQAIGQSMKLIIPPERSAEETDILARIARGELVQHFETVRIRADGTAIDISATISPLKDGNGKIIGASKIARDITGRKAHERKLQAQLERLNLLQQITHAIGERQDTQSIFQVAIRSLEEHLPIDFGCIALYEAPRNILRVTCVGAKSQVPARDLTLSEDASVTVDDNGLRRCVQGQLVYEPDIAESQFPFPARLARGGLRALVIVPLSFEDKAFGVLITARRQPASFASIDCEFLRHLSGQLALAAHQAQLYASLHHAYEDLRQTQHAVMQQERLRSLGQMAGGIAHDINNALSPATLYLQFLLERDPSLSRDAREYLTITQRAVDDVARTVARLRMFYRPPEAKLAMSPLDLNTLLEQVLELTRVRWTDMPQERGTVIRVLRELAVGLPPVIGAENEIRDALTNLIFNAVDAMRDGGTLTVRSRQHRVADTHYGVGATEHVSMEVCDTGVGMTEAVRSRCLEPFFTTKGERGSGLGLAMVYGMAQRHGAQLQIDSEPGVGTTVRIVFPAADLQELQRPSRPDRAPKPLRLLLVDDDPLLLKSLRDVLESDGHSVVTADGGQAGIEEFLAAHRSGESFAAVITDLGMPTVDGRTVMAAIKGTAPAIPVILLTGWGQRLNPDSDVSKLADCILGKPPQLSELRQTLAALTHAGDFPP